jgi:hypothetical protein
MLQRTHRNVEKPLVMTCSPIESPGINAAKWRLLRVTRPGVRFDCRFPSRMPPLPSCLNGSLNVTGNTLFLFIKKEIASSLHLPKKAQQRNKNNSVAHHRLPVKHADLCWGIQRSTFALISSSLRENCKNKPLPRFPSSPTPPAGSISLPKRKARRFGRLNILHIQTALLATLSRRLKWVEPGRLPGSR